MRSAWLIVTDSTHILLQGTPQGIDIDKLTAGLRNAILEVQDVHHVHAWLLTPQKLIITLHVIIDPNLDQDVDQDLVLEKVRSFLESQWQVGHATIQIERTKRTNCTEDHGVSH